MLQLLRAKLKLVAVLAVLGITNAYADVVTDWNEIALKTVAKANPLKQSCDMAIAQLAIFDAVNAIANTYRSYLEGLPAAHSGCRIGQAQTPLSGVARHIEISNSSRGRSPA